MNRERLDTILYSLGLYLIITLRNVVGIKDET